jgi:hypothetical protein
MSEEPKVSAQGLMSLIKLADKEFVNKIIAISKTVKVEKIEPDITRITIDLVNQK